MPQLVKRPENLKAVPREKGSDGKGAGARAPARGAGRSLAGAVRAGPPPRAGPLHVRGSGRQRPLQVQRLPPRVQTTLRPMRRRRARPTRPGRCRGLRAASHRRTPRQVDVLARLGAALRRRQALAASRRPPGDRCRPTSSARRLPRSCRAARAEPALRGRASARRGGVVAAHPARAARLLGGALARAADGSRARGRRRCAPRTGARSHPPPPEIRVHGRFPAQNNMCSAHSIPPIRL